MHESIGLESATSQHSNNFKIQKLDPLGSSFCMDPSTFQAVLPTAW